MATAVKRKLTGSTDGRGILVLATGSVGTTIHTSVVGVTPGTFDEVWIWAQNNFTADLPLTVQFGSSSVTDAIAVTVPYQAGLVPLVPGFILQNAAVVSAYAASGSVISLFGFVNAITD